MIHSHINKEFRSHQDYIKVEEKLRAIAKESKIFYNDQVKMMDVIARMYSTRGYILKVYLESIKQ